MFCFSCLWLLFFFTKTQSSLVYNAVDEEKLRESELLVRQVIMKYFYYGSSLALIFSSHVDTRNRFTKMQQPVFVFTFYNNSVECYSQSLDFQGYVFVTSCGNSSLEDQTLPALNCFSHNSSQLRSKRILIVNYCLEKDSYYSKHNLNSYLQFLWENYGLINVIIFPQSKNKKIVFTYNPFITGDTSKSGLVQAEVDEDFVKCFRKRFMNMNGYNIIGADLDSYNIKAGADFDTTLEKRHRHTSKFFRDEIEHAFNIAVTVQQPMTRLKSELDPNLITYASLLDDVNNNLVDFALIPQPINSVYQNIQYLTAKKVEPLVILIKKPLPISWQIIFYAFNKELWFWIGLAYTVLCISAIFLSNLQVSLKKSTRRDKMSLDLLRVCSNALLTKPFTKIPARNSERLLLGVCLCLGFFVNSILQGQVVNFMTSRPRPPSMDTFTDLVNSDIHIYYNELTSYNMEFIANSSLNRLGKRLHFEPLPDNKSDGNVGTICFEIRANLKLRCQRSLKEKLHIMNQRVVSLPMFYVLPKGSVLFEHFELLFFKLHEAGFFIYWDMTYYRGLCLESQEVFQMGSHYAVLRYKDLTLPFHSLYIGFTLSVICFILEIVSSKPCKKVLHLYGILISKNKENN